jgi:hypothetical protein
LLGVHVDFTPDLLARLWSGGICTSPVRTHWVTITNFMGSLPIPRFRVYLGTSSAWFGAARVRRNASLAQEPRAYGQARGVIFFFCAYFAADASTRGRTNA